MTKPSETLEARGVNYGAFTENARIARAIKAAMHDSPNWSRLSADKQESLELIATKISRLLNGNPEHYDSWHDIAGYAQLIADSIALPTFAERAREPGVVRYYDGDKWVEVGEAERLASRV